MKKFLFLSLLTLLSATVQAATITKLDKVPYPQYLTDITFDVNTNKLSFNDTYKSGEQLHRRIYTIHFYYREENNTQLMYVQDSEQYYTYGKQTGYVAESTEIYDAETQQIVKYVFNISGSKGGYIDADLNKYINQCIKNGYGSLHIAIEGVEVLYDNKTGEKKVPYEAAADNNPKKGSYLNNYIDVEVSGFTKVSLSTDKEIRYGQDMLLMIMIYGTGQTTYSLQQSMDSVSWQTREVGTLTTAMVRNHYGMEFHYTFNNNGLPAKIYYRLLVQDVKTGLRDTSKVVTTKVLYSTTISDVVTYLSPGEKFLLPQALDCKQYSVISDFPVQRKEEGGVVTFTQPACNVEIVERQQVYTVRFLAADYTLLKTDIVNCGEDAVAPQAPVLQGYTFKGWNRDITNVRNDFSVIAQYDMGSNYTFSTRLTEHTSPLHPYLVTFNNKKVTVGDSLTFAADVRTSAASYLSYQWAYRNTEGEWQWQDPVTVGTFSSNDAQQGKIRTFTQKVAVAYQYGYERAFQNGYAFRFRLYSAGTTIYSEPYEYELYYPILINSQIETEDGEYEWLYSASGTTSMLAGLGEIPARYNDTIIVRRQDNKINECMQFTRVNKPQFSLESGIDENGNAWFICPGETEKINITVSKKLVVFDGVYGDGYPKALDFTAQGFGKVNGYYAQVVNCGDNVTLPDDPEMEGYIFTGWKSWNDSEYADDAYLNVPATDDNIIGFTADFEPIPEDVIDAIEEVIGEDGSDRTRKVIYNGQLLIIRADGTIYNVVGVRVK